MGDCKTCLTSCCIAWGASLTATAADIEKWQNNQAMLEYVRGYDLWHDQEGERLPVCPFVELENGVTRCTIYPEAGAADMRPEICANYPFGRPCLADAKTRCTVGNHSIDIKVFKNKKRSQ